MLNPVFKFPLQMFVSSEGCLDFFSPKQLVVPDCDDQSNSVFYQNPG